MKKVRVRVTFDIDVEVQEGDHTLFMIEENSCPGTGVVGAAIEKAIMEAEEGNYCWACKMPFCQLDVIDMEGLYFGTVVMNEFGQLLISYNDKWGTKNSINVISTQVSNYYRKVGGWVRFTIDTEDFIPYAVIQDR